MVVVVGGGNTVFAVRSILYTIHSNDIVWQSRALVSQIVYHNDKYQRVTYDCVYSNEIKVISSISPRKNNRVCTMIFRDKFISMSLQTKH